MERAGDEVIHLRREPSPVLCGATGPVRITRTFREATCQCCIDAEDQRQGRRVRHTGRSRDRRVPARGVDGRCPMDRQRDAAKAQAWRNAARENLAYAFRERDELLARSVRRSAAVCDAEADRLEERVR